MRIIFTIWSNYPIFLCTGVSSPGSNFDLHSVKLSHVKIFNDSNLRWNFSVLFQFFAKSWFLTTELQMRATWYHICLLWRPTHNWSTPLLTTDAVELWAHDHGLVTVLWTPQHQQQHPQHDTTAIFLLSLLRHGHHTIMQIVGVLKIVDYNSKYFNNGQCNNKWVLPIFFCLRFWIDSS